MKNKDNFNFVCEEQEYMISLFRKTESSLSRILLLQNLSPKSILDYFQKTLFCAIFSRKPNIFSSASHLNLMVTWSGNWHICSFVLFVYEVLFYLTSSNWSLFVYDPTPFSSFNSLVFSSTFLRIPNCKKWKQCIKKKKKK